MNRTRTMRRYQPSREDRKQLDLLLGLALLDEQLSRRLVSQRDDSFLASFGLSAGFRRWLLGIEAASLEDLVRAIFADH